MGWEISHVDALIAGPSSPRRRGPSFRWARALALAALFIVGAARAEDPLETVRAALQQFAGKAPVSALLERAVTSERKDRPLEAGRATLEVSAGPDGISIGYPADLLEQLRAERADTDPEKARPAQRTLENFDAIDAAGMLNGATGLLRDLDGAVVKGAGAADYNGQPARLLELELVVRISRADSKWLKHASRSMKLWTTPDGVPLAEESESAFTVGLLIFNFNATESRTQAFAHAGDRLLTLRRTSRFDGEGLGESQHTTSETTLRMVGKGLPTYEAANAGR